MPKKKKKPVKSKRATEKPIKPLKKAPEKFTIDDFAPTLRSLIALQTLNSEQRHAVEECCEIIKYANYNENARLCAEQLKAFFLANSKTDANIIPSEMGKAKEKTSATLPRFDHG